MSEVCLFRYETARRADENDSFVRGKVSLSRENGGKCMLLETKSLIYTDFNGNEVNTGEFHDSPLFIFEETVDAVYQWMLENMRWDYCEVLLPESVGVSNGFRQALQPKLALRQRIAAAFGEVKGEELPGEDIRRGLLDLPTNYIIGKDGNSLAEEQRRLREAVKL